jgi:hypothetical protein
MEPAAWEVLVGRKDFPCSQLHAEDFKDFRAGKAFHVPSLRENKGNRAKYFFVAASKIFKGYKLT